MEGELGLVLNSLWDWKYSGQGNRKLNVAALADVTQATVWMMWVLLWEDPVSSSNLKPCLKQRAPAILPIRKEGGLGYGLDDSVGGSPAVSCAVAQSLE